MPVCLQIMHALKMHKGVNELCFFRILLPIRVVCFSCIKRGFAHVSVLF